jgi:hypothetical protein
MEDSARPWQRGGCIHELSVLGLQQVVTGDCLFWDLPALSRISSMSTKSHQSITSNFVVMIKENSSFLLLNRLEDGLGLILYRS